MPLVHHKEMIMKSFRVDGIDVGVKEHVYLKEGTVTFSEGVVRAKAVFSEADPSIADRGRANTLHIQGLLNNLGNVLEQMGGRFQSPLIVSTSVTSLQVIRPGVEVDVSLTLEALQASSDGSRLTGVTVFRICDTDGQLMHIALTQFRALPA